MQQNLNTWFPWDNRVGEKLNSSQARKPNFLGQRAVFLTEVPFCPAAVKQNQASIYHAKQRLAFKIPSSNLL